MNPFTEGLYVIFWRNRYARRDVVGGKRGSTVQQREKHSATTVYEFSSPQHQKHIHTQPFISPLSVSFGLETCVMRWWRFYTLFRPEQEHKGKLERNTLHLQMIKSHFLRRFMGVCKNNICTYVTYSHHIRISQLTMYNRLWSIQEYTETDCLFEFFCFFSTCAQI